MKKFLSILLTFCLMLTVMAVAFPVFAEDTYTITFVKANGTSTTEQYAADDAIVYPDLTASIYGDNVWSASQTAYAAVPKTATEDITVYEYLREGVYEFDNRYKVAYNEATYHTGWGLRLNDADDNGKKVLKFTNTAETSYSSKNGDGAIQSGSYTAATSYDRYNSIDLGKVPAGVSKTYRITVSVKREASTLPLYLLPWTNSKSMNHNKSQTKYTEKVISAVDNNETKYTEYTWEFTTPDNLVDNADNSGTTKGNYLFLHVGSRKAGECVAYIDYIIVEEVTYGDLTYHYADGTTKGVEDLEVGSTIDYADLAPNKLGENNGKWYTDAQGTTVAPAELPEGGLHVYEVVKTGVFDFNNYYRFQNYTGDKYGINNIDVINSIYADGNGDIIVDTTKYATTSNGVATPDVTNTTNKETLRKYVIAIGEAKVRTKYKITVEYSYTAENPNQLLRLAPLTGYGTLTSTNVNGKALARQWGDYVDLPQGTNQTVELLFEAKEDFYVNGDESQSDYKKAETGEVANSFYLNVRTTENSHADPANVILATISKVTVTEYTDSVIYNIPDNATVDGKNGEVELDYYGDEVPSFPEVQIAEGYESTGWTDTVTGAAVETPVLGGNYTLGVKKTVEKVTVTLNRGGVTEEEQVEKGSEYPLPDTQFTDTSWWSNEVANHASRFVGYEGEKIKVNGNVTFYTAETYSDGKTSIYRNWTGLDTTTEAFSYFYKNDTSGAAWAYSGTSRVCTRLGVVEDGKTYRISVTYKADTDAAINFYMLTTNVGNSGASTRNYLEDGKKFHVVAAGTKNEDWTTATFYITVDLPAQVTANADNSGLDDTKAVLHDTLYLNLGKAAGGENVKISIKETLVEDMGVVVTAKGASVLKEEKVVNGKQALRYYFDYKTGGNGTTITIGDNEYNVVERGFLYTNGAITHYAGAGTEGTSGNQTGNYFVCTDVNAAYGFTASDFMMWLAHAKKSANADKLAYKGIKEGFENNWAFDDATDTVTFSTYVTGIPTESYDAKMMVRGYVIFEVVEEDGTRVQHTIYSQTVNRSVNGIKTALGAAGEHEKHKD